MIETARVSYRQSSGRGIGDRVSQDIPKSIPAVRFCVLKGEELSWVVRAINHCTI